MKIVKSSDAPKGTNISNTSNKVILIQGAMDIEVEYLISKLNNIEKIIISEYEFWTGNIGSNKIIISKTRIGTLNATISTTIGIINFHPDFVINQGIAGAHRVDLHTGDIVIGEKCCNINAYSIPSKEKGQGSDPFQWEVSKSKAQMLFADTNLVNVVEKALKGILGSGDIFNREFDRIMWINNIFRK